MIIWHSPTEPVDLPSLERERDAANDVIDTT